MSWVTVLVGALFVFLALLIGVLALVQQSVERVYHTTQDYERE